MTLNDETYSKIPLDEEGKTELTLISETVVLGIKQILLLYQLIIILVINTVFYETNSDI